MKKSQIQVSVVTIILFVVIAIVLMIFAGKIMNVLEESRAREVCRTSILAADKTKVIGEKIVNIDCRMFFTDINKDGIYENGKRITPFKSTTDVEEEVKRAVANEIRQCWYQANEGMVNPFGEWRTAVNKCILCARINFADDVSVSKLNNFQEWYNTTKLKGQDQTYYDYAPAELTDIDAEGSYYVVYSIASYSRWRTVFYRTLEGATAGTMIGAGGVTLAGVGAVPGVIGGFAIGTGTGFIFGTVEALTEKNPYFPSVLITTPEGVQNVCQEIYN